MAEFYRESEIKETKEYKIRHLIIGLIIAAFLFSIIAVLTRDENGTINTTPTKNAQEKTLDIYLAGQEVKVGKSIWILRGVIDEGVGFKGRF